MALTTQWDKSKWSLIFERPNSRERGEEKKKRKEEEGEKFKQGQKGMELTLCIDSNMDFVWNSRKVYEFQT